MKTTVCFSLLSQIAIFVSAKAIGTFSSRELLNTDGRRSRESKPAKKSLRATVRGANNSIHRSLLEKVSSEIDRSIGVKELLVVRIEAEDSSTTASEEQLGRDIFGNTSLSTQFESCSHGKLIIEPATGPNINNGVTTINFDYAVGRTTEAISKEVDARATELFGRSLRQFDHVMMCMPNGVKLKQIKTGLIVDNWHAFVPGDYLYTNNLSFYMDEWCSSISAGMHEIGHNLGLQHSNESGKPYDDESGQMGYSGIPPDWGAKRCYNPSHSWQLGWYAEESRRINPLIDAPFSTILKGITGHTTNDSRNILLQIPNGQTDIVVGYNLAEGFNSGTIEGQDKAMVTEQEFGLRKTSDLKAMLESDESYTIPNYLESGKDLVIRVREKISEGREAELDVYFANFDDVPIEDGCADDQVRFEVSVKTDFYSGDTSWELIDDQTNAMVISRSNFNADMTHNDLLCIDRQRSFTFTLYDSYEDGICCKNGWGAFSVFLDGKEIFHGGEFEHPSVSHSFRTQEKQRSIVDYSVFSEQQQIENCADDPNFRFRETKTCEWVAMDREKRCDEESDGGLVKFSCPFSCGLCLTVDMPQSISNPDDTCRDDSTLRYKGVKNWNCEWVEKRKGKRCNNTWEGKSVGDICPKTCGRCNSTDNTTTTTDEEQPSAKIEIHHNVFCRDDPSFRFLGKRSCNWVAKKPSARCNKKQRGKLISHYCKSACGAC